MYGKDDIYNSPAAADRRADKIADSIAEVFGSDYEWYGKSEHKQKKAKIAKIAEKLQLLDKEQYENLHKHAKKLAKVVEKLEDKESDYKPEANVQAWVDYGNSGGEKNDLQALLNRLGRGDTGVASAGSGAGSGAGGDVTRPGDAAYYGPPPTGAYEYATGPEGQGYDMGYGPGGGDVNITNIYGPGGGRPQGRPQGKPNWRPKKPGALQPQDTKKPLISKPSWLGSNKPSKTTPSAKVPTPMRPGSSFLPGPKRPSMSASKPSLPKPSMSVSKPSLKAPAPARPSSKPSIKPGKMVGSMLKRSKFGAVESLSRDELFGTLGSESLADELSYGALPHASTDAFRPTMGQEALERTSILDPELDNEIDDALHELPDDARVDAIEEGYGAEGSGLQDDEDVEAIEEAYGDDTTSDVLLDEIEEEYGGANRAQRHENRDRMKQLSSSERRDVRQEIRQSLREQGFHPGRRMATAMIPGVGLVSQATSKKFKKARVEAMDKALDSRFGADDVDVDIMIDEIEEMYGADDEVSSGGKLDLSEFDLDDDQAEEPAAVSGKPSRRERRIGKSPIVGKKDIENQIDRLGRQYEAARRSGDTGKMREIAQLHAKATAAYREAQKAPELASRQQSLMTEKVGAWQY